MPTHQQFRGIWVPTITPFDYEDKILKNTITKHYDFLEEAGITGIIPLTPLGESPSLNFNEKVQILRKYGEEEPIMKLMPTILETSIKTAEYFVRVALSAGIDGIVLFPPYFYKNLRQNSLVSYYEKLIQETLKVEPNPPVFITYNDPYTQISMSRLSLQKLTSKYDNIYGIVDFSLEYNDFEEIKEQMPEIMILSCQENRASELLEKGIDGIISIVGNVFPELVNSLYNTYKYGDSDTKIEKLYLIQQKIKMILYLFKKYPLQAAIKYALYQREFPFIHTRLPLESLKEEQKTVLKDEIKSTLGKLSGLIL